MSRNRNLKSHPNSPWSRWKATQRRFLLKLKRSFLPFFVLLSALLFGTLVLPYILAGELYDYQDSFDGTHLPDVDAIVVLAGGRGRIAAGGDIWYRYWELSKRPDPKILEPPKPAGVPVLYLSGSGPQLKWPTLLKQLRKGVRDIIQPDNVLIEKESSNTEANALWFARNASQKGWKKILLVTSPYHMKRAHYIFQRTLPTTAGYDFRIDTFSVFQEPFEPSEWRTSLHGVHVTLIEYLKWIYYRYFWNKQTQQILKFL